VNSFGQGRRFATRTARHIGANNAGYRVNRVFPLTIPIYNKIRKTNLTARFLLF